MNRILISIVLITSLMGWALALDSESGVEMRPGETAAENLFNHGMGQAWTGGNPPSGSIDMKFSQYYSFNKGSGLKKHIEKPKKHQIENEVPATVYVSYQMQAVPYAQYKTYPAGGNSLWIQGSSSWTQYAQVPQGSSLSLLAISSVGGNGYLYEINPDGTLSMNSFYFFPGSNQIAFNADTVGQHILLYIIDNQVSNSIVINAVPYTPPYPYQAPVTSVQYYPQWTDMPPASVPVSTTGDSTAIIVSHGMHGYQVFLDGSYIGTEGMGGDPMDGKFTFRVPGDQFHEVKVYDGQFNYPKSMFFEHGGTKIINVEPGTAVYT